MSREGGRLRTNSFLVRPMSCVTVTADSAGKKNKTINTCANMEFPSYWMWGRGRKPFILSQISYSGLRERALEVGI